MCELDIEFEVFEKGSVESLLRAVYDEARVPDRTHLGIVLDANDHPDWRWNSIKDSLNRIGVDLPPAPEIAGTVVCQQENPQRLGVWMMPDNENCGELEDFLIHMIPVQDPIWPLSKNYIDQIEPPARKFKRGKRSRAELYAWLAVRRRPRLMGSAIGAGDVTVHGESCQRFVSWLTKLFR